MIAEALKAHLPQEQRLCIEALVLETIGDPPPVANTHSLLNWLVSETQREWLRPSGKERWEINSDTKNDVNLLKILKGSPFHVERSPARNCADNVLLMSALEPVFVARLDYFSKLVKKGFSSRNVFLLGGERELDSVRESEIRGLLGEDAREIDMLEYHASRVRKRDPWMSDLAYVSSSTPYKRDERGKLRRPNTRDTVITWLDESYTGGTILCLTNQPFVDYQSAIFQKLFPVDGIIDAAGASANHCNPPIVLDAIARLLYTLFS